MYPIDEAWSAAMHAQARLGCLGATLAFARVSFNYFISEAVFDYIVEAVHLLANEGWKLLPLYRFDPSTGLWHHAEADPRPLPSLHAFDPAGLDAGTASPSAPESALAHQLEEARRIIRTAETAPALDPAVSAEFDRIRWFPLPSEARASVTP